MEWTTVCSLTYQGEKTEETCSSALSDHFEGFLLGGPAFQSQWKAGSLPTCAVSEGKSSGLIHNRKKRPQAQLMVSRGSSLISLRCWIQSQKKIQRSRLGFPNLTFSLRTLPLGSLSQVPLPPSPEPTHRRPFPAVQFDSCQLSSVAQSCPTLCEPMNRSTPGLPVHHQLPESTQTHVHRVGDAIQPSHPLSSPSPPAFNPSQHQGLFKWISSSHQVAKVLEFQLQHQSFQ